MTAAHGFKSIATKIQLQLRTKQHERRRRDIVFFHAAGLKFASWISRGSVLAPAESRQ